MPFNITKDGQGNVTATGTEGAELYRSDLQEQPSGQFLKNVIYGYGGSDIITVDVYDGLSGELKPKYNNNTQLLYGGEGDDTVVLSYGFLTGTGGQIDSSKHGLAGSAIYGEGGNDVIHSVSTEGVLLDGGSGNDTILGGGHSGGDLFYPNMNCTLQGGAGQDQISSFFLSKSVINGGDGDDTIRSEQFSETRVNGGDGNDVFNIKFTLGNTAIHGDKGNDIFTITLGSVYDRSGQLKDNGTDTAYGDSGDDTITMRAVGGYDTRTNVLGGEGRDDIRILSSSLTLSMVNGGRDEDAITSDAFIKNSTIRGGAQNDSINILKGYSDGTAIFGDKGNDTITVSTLGFGNNGTISGGEGNDLINLQSATRDSLFLGDSGNDTIIYKTIEYNPAYSYNPQTGSLTRANFEINYALVIRGGEGDDLIQNAGNPDIWAELFGQPRAFEYGQPNAFFSGAGNDTTIGTGSADSIRGGLGNDSLVGGAGNDTMWGGDGRDTISGGSGVNILSGGAGADVFAYNKSSLRPEPTGTVDPNGVISVKTSLWQDVITDFSRSDGDKLAFSNGLKFSDLMITSANQGGVAGALVTIDNGNDPDLTIFLQGVSAGSLTSSDFMF